jgi:hypothetical protein
MHCLDRSIGHMVLRSTPDARFDAYYNIPIIITFYRGPCAPISYPLEPLPPPESLPIPLEIPARVTRNQISHRLL